MLNNLLITTFKLSTIQQMWSIQSIKSLSISLLTAFLIIAAQIYSFANPINNKSATKVYHVKLSEEIQPAASRLIKNAFQAAAENEADLILIEINTYGGRVDIADSIRSKILYSKIPTIAYINNNAASAGALISLACDSIYMKPGASIGAATVVDGASGEQMPDKYQSYMRGMIRSTAETKGRNPDIAEAMVDERKVVEGISEAGKVLTLTSVEALKYNMANGIVNSTDEILQKLNIENSEMIEHETNTADQLINFLLNPLVNSLLILVIIGGIYFELKTPGLGFPILAALTGAILYFAPLIIDGTANVWEILLFAAGIILLLLEIFVIPGFGVAGIAGIICIVAALTFSLVDMGSHGFEFNFIIGDLLVRAFFRVMVVISFAFGMIFFFGESILNMPGFNKLILKSEQVSAEGYTVKRNELYDLIGREAIVVNQLRPAGKVAIDEQHYQAISTANMIEKDTKVKVTGVNGYSLIVSELS